MYGVRKLLLCFAALLSLVLLGCGGGSSSTTTASDNGTVLVKTTLDLTGAKAKTGKAATDVAVTITAADGTVYTMTPTGNGDEYECRIAYTDGDPLYIKAQIGNVVLRNFVSGLTATSAGVDMGATSPATTLFVDVLQSMAQEVDSSITDNVTFVATLLSGIKHGTFAVDVDAIRTQVLGNSASESPVISQLMTEYQAQMTWVNAGSSDNMVIQHLGQMVSSVASTIHSSGMMIPASSDVAEELVTIAQGMQTDSSKALDMIYTDGFLMYGQTAASFIGNYSSSTDDPWAGLTLNYIKNTAKAVPVSVDSDVYRNLSPDGTDIYRVYFSTHKQGLDSTGAVVMEEAYDDIMSQDPGIILQKINGVWYFRGNQQKAEVNFDFMHYSTDPSTGTGIHLGVAGADYPITSVAVTSDIFAGEIPLVQRADGEYVLDLQMTGNQTAENTNTMAAVNLTDTSFDGHQFTMVVSYQDGTTETYVRTVPTMMMGVVPTVSAEKQTDGTVKVSYVVPDNMKSSMVMIMLQNNGGDEVRAELLPFGTGSYTFQGLNFQTGLQYTFELVYYTLDGISYRRTATITY